MSYILRLALQRSGRLAEQSLQLLMECGIDLPTGKSALKSRAINFPLELLFLRDDDIPAYVSDAVADCGIVGLNVIAEGNRLLEVRDRLGFGACRLSLAVPRDYPYQSLESLAGKRIATSHARILEDFLRGSGIQAEVHRLSGSVEIAPSIGLADAVCDLVSTGSTLASNGLREVEVVFRSEAVLIEGKEQSSPSLERGPKRKILDELLLRFQAVRRARHTKYIMLNAPNSAIAEITSLIPGVRSPSIIPLADSGWSSVHSVVQEDQFWDVMSALKAAGAQGILVLPIEKLVT